MYTQGILSLEKISHKIKIGSTTNYFYSTTMAMTTAITTAMATAKTTITTTT